MCGSQSELAELVGNSNCPKTSGYISLLIPSLSLTLFATISIKTINKSSKIYETTSHEYLRTLKNSSQPSTSLPVDLPWSFLRNIFQS